MKRRELIHLLSASLSVALFVGCERASETEAMPETPRLSVEAESEVAEATEASPKPSFLVLYSGAQIYPAYEEVENGFPVTIGIDDGQVVFKSSNAKGFELPGGEIVGVTRFEDLSDDQRKSLVHEPGFAYTCDSADGWQVAWNWEKPPSPDDPILWAFKRTPRPVAEGDFPPSDGWTIELEGD